MSKHNPPSFMGGSMRKKSGAHDAPHKTNKNSRSVLASKTKTRAAAEADTSGEGSDDDGEASSATEEAVSSNDEPDVSALASVRQQHKGKAALRLPGHELTGDDLFSDIHMGDAQASPGAQVDEKAASDDEDYAGLEDVSESDDDEVEMAEATILKSVEQDLIEEFEMTEQRRIASTVTTNLDVMALRDDEDTARRLGLMQDDDLFGGVLFPVDMNVDPFGGLSSNADEYRHMWDAAEQTIWRMPDTARSRESSDPISGTQKRVRFDEDPSEAFPDLFTPADDPVINHQIAIGLFHDTQIQQRDYNDNESFYDFDDEDEELAFQIDEESNSDDDTSSYDCMYT